MTASCLQVRLINRTLRGKFCYKREGTMGFQESECVLVNCAHERRSAIRLGADQVVSRRKIMLHALAYTLWCDPNFNCDDWRSLRRKHNCMYGYCGGEGNSGWAHNKYCCVNPFHYQHDRKVPPNDSSGVGDLTLHKHEQFRLHLAPPNPEMFIQLNGDKVPARDDSMLRLGNGNHSPDEFRWLCDAHQKFALVGTDDNRSAPDEADVIKRLVEKVHHGTFTRKLGDRISFEKDKCVLVMSPREARSSVRIDIVNFASKCWPQALTYRLFRDPYFQLKEWQNLRRIRCCKHGYAGPKCGGSGGWPTENFICVNPFHYEVVHDSSFNGRSSAAATTLPNVGTETGSDGSGSMYGATNGHDGGSSNGSSESSGSSASLLRESLPSVLVELLLDDNKKLLLHPMQPLFVAEDVVDKIYVVVSGELKLTRRGHSLSLRRMDLLGSLAEADLGPASCGYSTVATTSSMVCVIDQAQLHEIFIQYPSMVAMVHEMRSRIRNELKFARRTSKPKQNQPRQHRPKAAHAHANADADADANADATAVAGILCEMDSTAGASQ